MKFLRSIVLSLFILIIAACVVGCDNEKEPDENGQPIPLDTRYTDELELDELSFVGKDFITDGIGKVQLNRVFDGDTISVYSGGEVLTIRFLGIDTPESTGRVEAWGKAATVYAKEVLENAHSIVIEAEGERIDSTGRRYLAWVWYQPEPNTSYRLLNLEQVELAWTRFMVITTSKYFEEFYAAQEKASKSQRRVWGETDPNFNYSREVIETSLLYLSDNPTEFQSGTRFQATVKLVRTIGNNMYLEDAYEAYYHTEDGGIVSGKGYVYSFYGYTMSYYQYYKIGDVFTLEFQYEFEGNFGTQLTGLQNPSRVIENVNPEILEINADDLDGGRDLEQYFGRVVQLQNLEIVNIDERTTARGESYFLVKGKNQSGKMFDIYFSNNLITRHAVLDIFEIGEFYNIIGGVAHYEFAEGEYQISVGDAPRYRQGEIREEDILRKDDIVKVE